MNGNLLKYYKYIKDGDKIKCIDAKFLKSDSNFKNFMKIGKVFEVRMKNSEYIKIKERADSTDDGWWCLERFDVASNIFIGE